MPIHDLTRHHGALWNQYQRETEHPIFRADPACTLTVQAKHRERSGGDKPCWVDRYSRSATFHSLSLTSFSERSAVPNEETNRMNADIVSVSHVAPLHTQLNCTYLLSILCTVHFMTNTRASQMHPHSSIAIPESGIEVDRTDAHRRSLSVVAVP